MMGLRCKEAANVIHDNAPGSHQMTCHHAAENQLLQACGEKKILTS